MSERLKFIGEKHKRIIDQSQLRDLKEISGITGTPTSKLIKAAVKWYYIAFLHSDTYQEYCNALEQRISGKR
jgi:hypothetical protein